MRYSAEPSFDGSQSFANCTSIGRSSTFEYTDMRASGRRYTASTTLLSTRCSPSCADNSSIGEGLVVAHPASSAQVNVAATIVSFMAAPQSEAIGAEQHSVIERVG